MKEFIEAVGKNLNIQRTELLEKDIRIHQLLFALSKDTFFSNNFVFKGGTCLIKCYLGYYRFSEDIDFTWKDQSVFEGKSQKEIRRIISGIKDEIGLLLVDVAKKHGFDFVLKGTDKNFIEFGGGNKTVTFKLWYTSEMLGAWSFIKIQINFVELILFPVKKQQVYGLLKGTKDKESRLLFPDELKSYSKTMQLYSYDLKEIVCEKVRAILTRRGVKARDFVDLFLIKEQYGIHVGMVKKEAISKTRFILDLYVKYRTNLEEKRTLIASKELFRWGAEKNLLLKDIDEQKFYRFVQDLGKDLKIITQEVLRK